MSMSQRSRLATHGRKSGVKDISHKYSSLTKIGGKKKDDGEKKSLHKSPIQQHVERPWKEGRNGQFTKRKTAILTLRNVERTERVERIGREGVSVIYWEGDHQQSTLGTSGKGRSKGTRTAGPKERKRDREKSKQSVTARLFRVSQGPGKKYESPRPK